MATNTTKYGLKKPAYSDTADISDINDNMDTIDSVLDNQAGTVGIVCNGKRCATSASTGQYVILQNSSISGRSDGLYTAAKAIPANTDLDSSYLTAVSGGGLNAINSKVANLDIDCKSIPEVIATKASGITTMAGLVRRNAFIVNGMLGIDIPSNKLTTNSELAVLNMSVNTSLDVRIVAQNINTRSVGSFRIYANNGIPTLTVDNNIALPDAGYYFIPFTFLYY